MLFAKRALVCAGLFFVFLIGYLLYFMRSKTTQASRAANDAVRIPDAGWVNLASTFSRGGYSDLSGFPFDRHQAESEAQMVQITKTPTPTSPSCDRPRRSTPSCSSPGL
jgi:hypothetical protein